MKGRLLGRKPALALWMLIAVADFVLVVAAIGVVTVLSVLGGLLALGTGVWQLRRHIAPARRPAPAVLRRQSRVVAGRRA